MLKLSECVPGTPVISESGTIGIVTSKLFDIQLSNWFGEGIETVKTVQITCGNGSIIQHANLEAFSVYRGKNHDTSQ